MSARVRSVVRWSSEHRLDVAWMFGLFVIALVVRLPNLMFVPRYTDEGAEVLGALDILRTGQMPLTGINGFYGPFYWYLIAALFHWFGVSLFIPRLTTTVFGALLVSVTYALGRVVWNRTTGVWAAGLALTSPALVIYTSHYGWSNSLTPFFAILTLLTLFSGLTRQMGWLVVLSGAFAALTLHTHPTGLIVLLAAGIAFLIRHDARRWLRRRSPYLAVVLFFICYMPMLVANVRLDSPIAQKFNDVSGILSPTLDPIEYVMRAFALAKVVLFVVAGGYEGADVLLLLTAAAAALLLVVGCIAVSRRESRFVAVVLLASLMLFPLFLREFPIRYFMPPIPLAFVLLGVVASEAFRVVADRHLATPRQWASVPLLVLMAALVIVPLLTIRAVYQNAFAQGRTNEEYFRLAREVAASEACGLDLYVEDSVRDFSSPQTIQTWYMLHVVDYVLTLEACQHTMLSPADVIECLRTRCRLGWLIVPQDDLLPAREHAFQLITVAMPPPVEKTRVPIGFYRVTATD